VCARVLRLHTEKPKRQMKLPHLPPLRFFASVGRPLERYFTEIVKAERPSREADLWMEAQERLAQLDFLLCRAVDLQKKHWSVMSAQVDAVNTGQTPSDRERIRTSADSRRRASLAMGLMFELKLSTEAFYYSAARFIRILKCFPQLKKFDAPGVRKVRNHLLEHSESAGGITNQNWGYGDTGPALRSTTRRPPGKGNVPNDPGLFVNAAELRDGLEPTRRNC
jgi:hypothetical protein